MRIKNKYRAKKTTYNGVVFDSKKEAKRYGELLILVRIGEIKDLKLQPEFVLQDKFNGVLNGEFKSFRKIVYRADFRYTVVKSNKLIIEDTKGFKTPVYKLKLKLLLAKYPHINFYEK